MIRRVDIKPRTVALMVLKPLDVLEPPRSYGNAQSVEQFSKEQLALDQGTLYPFLFQLEQEWGIASRRDSSEKDRRTRSCRLKRAGCNQLQGELASRYQSSEIIALFPAIKTETSL